MQTDEGTIYRAAAGTVALRAERLAACSDNPGSITRIFLSPAMADAHRLLTGWMEEAGLSVRRDHVGNLIGRWTPPEADDSRARLVIGSHIDTVIDAGRWDGVLGVLVGLETVTLLQRETVAADAGAFATLPIIEIVAFSEEEGVRYRLPFIGSRAVTGSLDPTLLSLTDESGVSLSEAIRLFGGDPTRLGECSWESNRPTAYVEAHIEQGPVLESLDLPVGVVTAIAGQRRAEVRFRGRAGHAGTVPMMERRDALVAAATWVTAVDRLARVHPGLVATVGTMMVHPGASNVIPGDVTCTLDCRHGENSVRDAAMKMLRTEAVQAAAAHRCELEWRDTHEAAAVPMNGALTTLLQDSAGAAAPRLVSGAGHDAMIMAGFCPSAMLFVRSPGGISHHPDEDVVLDDVAEVVRVLVRLTRTFAPVVASKVSTLNQSQGGNDDRPGDR